MTDPDAPAGLPHLTVTTLVATYVAETPVHLPRHAGTTFRGALGNALRAVACTTAATVCDGCARIPRCVYGSLWAYVVPTPDGGAEDVPKPYVIAGEPAVRGRRVDPGEPFTLALRLFGAARGYWPHVVEALRLAGAGGFGPRVQAGDRRAPVPVDGVATLSRVVAHGARGSSALLYRDAGGVRFPHGLVPDRVAPDPAPDLAGRVRLAFVTPLGLSPVHKAGEPAPSDYLTRFDAVRFAEALAGRFAALVERHEMVPPAWDPAPVLADAAAATLVEAHTALRPSEQFSRPQQKRLQMPPLVGHVVLDGVTPALAGLLRLADVIHVGRNATKGFGRVALEPAP